MTKEGVDLVKSFESCRLVAYRGIDDKWTIGWGRSRNVKEGDVCSQEQADQWLEEDLADFERMILLCISPQITDNQLSALVSFTYNVGLGYKGIKDGFKVLKSGEPSSLLKYLRLLRWEMAAAEFPKWDKCGGIVVDGLLRRRMAEKALFEKTV
jgi:lysozyme